MIRAQEGCSAVAQTIGSGPEMQPEHSDAIEVAPLLIKYFLKEGKEKKKIHFSSLQHNHFSQRPPGCRQLLGKIHAREICVWAQSEEVSARAK